MICPKCNPGTLNEGYTPLPATVKELAVSVFVNAFSCDRCDYKTVHGSQMGEFMRLAADEYRKCLGLLTSIQIRTARDRIMMSQEKFAEYLGVGVASVKRWELGQVQDKAMDNLIRLKTDTSAAADNYDRILELSRRNTDSTAAPLYERAYGKAGRWSKAS